MSNRRTKEAAGIARELLVVCVGVLVALGVDSWWENHQDRTRLHANLEVLLRDMKVADKAIADAIHVDSTVVENLSAAQSLLVSRGAAGADTLSSLLELNIKIAPVPLGTLRLLVNSGEIRLIRDQDARTTLVSALSRLDLYSGWMDALATDGRRVHEAIVHAQSRAQTAGRSWPAAAVGDPDVLAAADVLEARINNIAALLRASRDLVQAVGSAAQTVVGQDTDSAEVDH